MWTRDSLGHKAQFEYTFLYSLSLHKRLACRPSTVCPRLPSLRRIYHSRLSSLGIRTQRCYTLPSLEKQPHCLLSVSKAPSDFDYSVSKVSRPGIAGQQGWRGGGVLAEWEAGQNTRGEETALLLGPPRVHPLCLDRPQLIYKALSVLWGGGGSSVLRKYSKMSLPSKANKSRALPPVSDLSLWNSPL